MRSTEKTKSVQYLVAQGISYKNAYRIMYKSKGTAAKILAQVLPAYMELIARNQAPKTQ